MPNLLRIALENAAVATLFALVLTALRSPLRRRPALSHVLWTLVLLKLITPPLWDLPAPRLLESLARAEAEPALQRFAPEIVRIVGRLDELEPQPDRFAVEPRNVIVDVPEAPAIETPIVEAAGASGSTQYLRWVVPAVAGVWLAGSLATLVLSAVRVYRLKRALALAKPAPDGIRELTEQVAEKIGLGLRPQVMLVPGEVSPMVWGGLGRPWLVLPWSLWGRLDGTQRETLLAHELAHLKRGDHFVRWLEQAVTVLYWWFPVAWWARRALREAEEECCDAWVVWAVPGAARAYAETLVETVDFLNDAQTRAPASASAFGQAHQLKRRVIMIMKGTTHRSPGLGGHLLSLTVAGALLPFTPTWAQKPDAEPKAKDSITIEARTELPKVVVDVHSVNVDKPGEFKVVRDDGHELRFQIENVNDKVLGKGQELKFQIDELKDVELPDLQNVLIQVDDARAKVNTAVKEAIERLKKELAEAKENGKGGDLASSAIQKAIEGIQQALNGDDDDDDDDDDAKVKADKDAKGDKPRIVIRRREEVRSDDAKPADPKEQAEKAAAREKAAAELKELKSVIDRRNKEVREASQKLREAQRELAEASRKAAEVDGRRANIYTSRTFRSDAKDPKRGVVEFFRTDKPPVPPIAPVPPVPPVTPLPPNAIVVTPRAVASPDFERRLSELEKKLDRVLDKLDSKDKGDRR